MLFFLAILSKFKKPRYKRGYQSERKDNDYVDNQELMLFFARNSWTEGRHIFSSFNIIQRAMPGYVDS